MLQEEMNRVIAVELLSCLESSPIESQVRFVECSRSTAKAGTQVLEIHQNFEKWNHRSMETWKHGNMEASKHGSIEAMIARTPTSVVFLSVPACNLHPSRTYKVAPKLSLLNVRFSRFSGSNFSASWQRARPHRSPPRQTQHRPPGRTWPSNPSSFSFASCSCPGYPRESGQSCHP